MRWFFLCVTTLFLACAARSETTDIHEFGGLNTDDSPAVLPQTQTPDSENVLTDVGSGIYPREGFSALSTTTCQGGLWLFIHSNGTRYIVCHDTSVNILKASANQGVSFTTTISTVASGIPTAVSALGDKLFFSNTTDGLKYWDTTNVTLVNSALTFSQLATHKGCLWGAGITSASRTIYKSAFGDGTNYTVPVNPTATDPALFVVGGSVDEPLTGLYASFQDKLIWFKSNSFGGILGNSNNDFSLRVFSDRLGTAYPQSVQDCKGFLRWLGGGRHVWEYDGANLNDLSDQPESKIRTLLDTVTQGDANARALTLTSQSDFASSTHYQTSPNISPNDVVLSTWTDADSTNSQFGSGSTSNTSVIGDAVYLSKNDTNVLNNGFEDGSGANPDNWDGEGGVTRISWEKRTGTYSLAVNYGGFTVFPYYITDVNKNILETGLFGPGSSSYNKKTVSLAAYAGRWIRIGFGFGSPFPQSTSDPFLCSGGDISWYAKQIGPGLFSVDDVEGGRSSIYSGTFTSRTFNTSFTSGTWLPSNFSFNAYNNLIDFETQTSPDGTNWSPALSWGPTAPYPGSPYARYIRYVVTMSTGGTTNGTSFPYFNYASLSARAIEGKYISGSYSLGSISSWGFFEAQDAPNGGTIGYSIYTDTDATKSVVNGVPVASSYSSSQTITSGSLVTLSTAAYVFFGSTFTVTAGSYTPTLQQITVRWSEGVTLKVPSLYYNNRYWLGVAINSASNNRVLVFDKKRQWQKWSGMNVASAVLSSGNPLFSNSSWTFQAGLGTTDAGTAIASYYKTPTLSPAGPYTASNLREIRVVADNSASTLATTFQVNNINTNFSLGNYAMNTNSGIQAMRLPFPTTEIQKARSIDFKFSVTGTTRWRLLGMTLDFTPDKVPE